MKLETVQAVCRRLPPILAQRLRVWLYPYAAARRESRKLRVRTVTGGSFEGSTGDYHAHPMLVHGYFEWRNVAVCLAACRAGEMVVEVGANVGTETVSFADIVGPEGKVIAFEPDEENFAALTRLRELNQWTHVELVKAAVSDHEGEAWFEPTDSRPMSGIGRIVSQPGPGRAVAVRTVTLDSLLDDGVGRVAGVFVDVEGHEVAVLRGGRRLLEAHRPVVVLEASPRLLAKNGWGLADLAGELGRLGYRCWRIGRFGLCEADASARNATNWLGVPEERQDLAPRIESVMRRACWMPMIRGLNPLAKI